MQSLSVIIPVLNEELRINNTLKSLFASLSEITIPIEVIVVDGSETGNTLSVIYSSFNVLKIMGPKGRSLQMNMGVQKSSGSYLLFLHADTTLYKDSIHQMLSAFDRGCRAGSFDLHIKTDSILLKIFSSLAASRSRVTRVPFGDQGHFITSELFEIIGGYPQIPLMEDVEFMVSIRKKAIKITILKSAVITSARRWERNGIWRGSIRNHLIRTAHRWGIKPETLARFYDQGVDK
jgi:uncharacterized protein